VEGFNVDEFIGKSSCSYKIILLLTNSTIQPAFNFR